MTAQYPTRKFVFGFFVPFSVREREPEAAERDQLR